MRDRLEDEQFINRLAELGSNQSALARELGISPAAVSKRKKKILTVEGRALGVTAGVVDKLNRSKPSAREVRKAISVGRREAKSKLDVLELLVDARNILIDIHDEIGEDVARTGKTTVQQRQDLFRISDRYQSIAKTYLDIRCELYNTESAEKSLEMILDILGKESGDLQVNVYNRMVEAEPLMKSYLKELRATF